jgi:hypothetical protein
MCLLMRLQLDSICAKEELRLVCARFGIRLMFLRLRLVPWTELVYEITTGGIADCKE